MLNVKHCEDTCIMHLQAAGQQAPNCGQESNPSAAESVNSPSSMGHPRMHVNLYIAELDVDALESAAPAAPLDLVSPSEAAAAPVASTSARAAAADTVPPSHSQGGTLTNISADGSNSRQASSLGLASTPANPASEGNGFVSRISQRLSGLISSQAAQSHANQQALSQVQLPGQDLEANSAADGGSRTGVPQQSSSASVQEQARLGVSPSRSWWPFSRAA